MVINVYFIIQNVIQQITLLNASILQKLLLIQNVNTIVKIVYYKIVERVAIKLIVANNQTSSNALIIFNNKIFNAAIMEINVVKI